MSQANPFPRDTRERFVTVAAAQTVFGPFDFKIFDPLDVAVWWRASSSDPWQELAVDAVTLSGAAPAFFSITKTGLATGTLLRIRGQRVHERSTNVVRANVVSSEAVERQFDEITVTLQELRRDQDTVLDDLTASGANAEAADAAAEAAAASAAQAEADRLAVAAMGSFGYDFDTRAAAAAGAIAAGKDSIRLAGHTTAGLGAALYVEIGANPGHGLAFEAPTGSGRWWIVAPEINVTPYHAGGMPDNAGLTDAAITAILAARPGLPVDLGGATWATTLDLNALGFQPYHGGFRNGSTVRLYPDTPMAHPLAAGSPLTIRLPGHERPYASGLMYRPGVSADTREFIMGVTNHKKHVTQPGDTLTVYRSMSGGLRWNDGEAVPVPITEGVLGGSVVGAYGVDNAGIGGKFGFLLTTIDASSVRRCYFASSYGDAWTLEQLASLNTLAPFFHGRVLNVPAAEGGSATTWIATGYSETAPNEGCHVAVTTNAFTSASTSVYKAKAWGDQSISDATECCLAKAGANQYYLIARRDGGGNLVSAFKANPLVAAGWGAWVDTKIPCGANPPLVIEKWGRLYFFVAARRGTPIDGYEDALLVCSISKTEWHANGGCFTAKPAWSVVMQGLEHLTGYSGYAENFAGDPLFVGNHNETLTGSANPSASSIFALTPYRAPAEAPALISRRWNRNTLNPDPALRYAPYGKAFTGIGGTRKMISTGISFIMTGGTADFTYQELDARIADAASFSPRNAWRVNNSASGSGRSFVTRIMGIENVRRLCRSGPISGRIEFVGQIPPYYQAYAYVHPGTGGSPSAPLTGPVANAKQADYASGLFAPTVVITPPDISGMIFGTNDNAYIDLFWVSNNAGAAFCDLAGVAWWLSDQPWEIEPYELAEEMPRILTRVELIEFAAGSNNHVALCHEDASNNAVGSLRFAPKFRAPAIALAAGTAANQFVLNGTACNAITFDHISDRACRIIATTGSALVDHSMQELYWGSGSAGGILINAENLS